MKLSRASIVLSLALLTLLMTAASKTFAASASYPSCTSFEAGVLPDYFSTDTTSNSGANGRVAVTTAFPHTGSWGLDLDTDCGVSPCSPITQQAADMVVNLAGQSGVYLDFWVFEHGDENNPEDGVFISDDGGTTWALIQSLNNFPTSYQRVLIDLDTAVAGAGMSYVEKFTIRFQSLDNFSIPTDGYSFDDICVRPLATSYPVCTSFETGVLPDYFITETTSDGDANGRVAVTTAFPNTGSSALDLDTDCDGCGGSTQQAAIMLVDLAGRSGVFLNFWVFEHGDENNPEDGVFISDDGGTTWALIQTLNNFPSSYQMVSIDLDTAVADAGMSYVKNFMIRFQSFDNFSIPTDGYSFDDICVQPLPTELCVPIKASNNALAIVCL